MNETETEEATGALAALIVQLIRSKGRKMHNGRNKPAMRLLLETRRPQDDLPGLYERLGSLIKRRGEVESELRSLKDNREHTECSAEELRTLQVELERIKSEVADLNGEIKAIEGRRTKKNIKDTIQ